MNACNCCGKQHQRQGLYCDYCSDCDGSCDWFGTEEELNALTESLNPSALEGYDDVRPGQRRENHETL